MLLHHIATTSRPTNSANFSGSLVEKNSSNKTTSAGIDLMLRSSSCNADRGASSRLGVVGSKYVIFPSSSSSNKRR